MRLLPGLLIFLCITVLAWAGSGQLNDLYSYEADLRQALAELDDAPKVHPTEWTPLELPLPRKGKLFDQQGSRVKLPRDTQVMVSGVSHDGKNRWWTVTPVDSSFVNLRMREHKSFAAEFGSEWITWRRQVVDDSLQVLRELRTRDLRRWILTRELGEVNAVAKTYRKPGRHTMMDPVAYLQSRVIPEWRQSDMAIVFAWNSELELSDTPWGYPVETHSQQPEDGTPLLVFDGMENGTYCLRPVRCASVGLARDGYYFATPAAFEHAMGKDAARLLSAFAEDLRTRLRENRRYDLLDRWAPDVVSRILDGLAWKGMSEAMLNEALGTPAEAVEQADGTVRRTYATGNVVVLRGDTVIDIQQSKD